MVQGCCLNNHGFLFLCTYLCLTVVLWDLKVNAKSIGLEILYGIMYDISRKFYPDQFFCRMSSQRSSGSLDSLGWDPNKQLMIATVSIFSLVTWLSGNIMLASITILMGNYKFQILCYNYIII